MQKHFWLLNKQQMFKKYIQDVENTQRQMCSPQRYKAFINRVEKDKFLLQHLYI